MAWTWCCCERYVTPSGKIEFYSKQAEETGLPPLPGYQELPDSDFPLHLRMGRMLTHFHSFYDYGRALPSLAKLEAQPALWMSRADAADRGVKDGDAVRIHNERGSCNALAEVSDKVPVGTVWVHDGWPDLNTLTVGSACLPDGATTLFPFSTGQSGYDARVEVRVR